jgi:RimJ/RimL family protein N-acetyltransferase
MKLRPYTGDDRALTVALESDPQVMGHLGGPIDEQDATRVHETRMAAIAAGDLFHTILPDDDPRPAGVVAVWRSEWAGTPIHEIGVMLLPRHQSRGLAVQAVQQILPYARGSGIRSLHGFAAVTNTASHAVAVHAGFHRAADCDMSYNGRPMRCAHWILDL